MPASKQTHVLAILRKQLSLKQSELAELVGCSVSAIQSIELNRLPLSERLAARISARTGAELDWLLKNDVNEPVPPIRRVGSDSSNAGHESADATAMMLLIILDRLFAIARRLPKTQARRTLELNIGWFLDALKNSEGDPSAEYGLESDVFESPPELFDHELEKIINFKYLVETQQRYRELEAEADRKSDIEWKKLRKEIKAKPADQLSDDDKAFLKADAEGKKFRRQLNADVKAQIAKEKAELLRTSVPAETESRRARQAPSRSRRLT